MLFSDSLFRIWRFSLQVIKFVVGQSSVFTFPLRNSGDIPLDVDMMFTDWPDLFSVRPVRVKLDPGQQVMSSVTFRHRFECHATRYERYAVHFVQIDSTAIGRRSSPVAITFGAVTLLAFY